MAKSIVTVQDFVFNSDKTHARLSRRGVASLLKVSHTAINKLLKTGNLYNPKEAETIEIEGFHGGNLVRLIRHFLDSNQTKSEIKTHCGDLFEKCAIIGAQKCKAP